jgi:transcriptional regulator with GAF, ATPase, and Fis domain
MPPNLIAISGSLKGTIFGLTEDETSVGRDASNSISLNDLSVSRRHCIVKRESEQEIAGPTINESDSAQVAAPNGATSLFTITDLDSFNGTFVNGIPVKEKELAHGDQIALGDVILLFLSDESEPATKTLIASGEDNLITRSTIRLRKEDALYLRPEKVLAELAPTARVARDLNALLKISRALSSIRNIDELHHEIFRLILEAIPGERIAILLADNIRGTFSSSRGWSRSYGSDDSIKGSQTIINQVMQEAVALLSNDLIETEEFSKAPSLLSAHVCSVLCVPLTIFEKTLGIIYLETSDRTARFDEDHLQLLAAIAGIAASALENAQHLEWFAQENQRLHEEIRVEHRMIGQSPAMQAVIKFIGRAAPTDATVLIRGESGTGKELAAHAIHLNSSRSEKPFVAINGATLSETLLESELFGHEKGAFTGAISQKRGKLEVADGGTLFLDEVGELAPTIQAKLLRVLQEREFERVGGTRPIKVDVRLVAATNKDLEAAIRAGTFRQDLYYRINVVTINMPALKDRADDIQLLASYFVSVYSKECKRRINGIFPQARALLRAYDWPGNVRELQNAIERAVVLGSSEMIMPEDLPEALVEAGDTETLPAAGYHELLKQAKRSIVLKAIENTQGNYTEAAKQLGLHPTNLHRLIRNLDLRSKIKG